ncbi:hypothetical protein K438DRAFT_1787357 [Mycena galopus ATCC 62051]|nr:hypothetical protein K438DRAFT_1787357 [Mycena galopus ATCC 62051]
MARISKPYRIPSQSQFLNTIIAQPSPTDGPGGGYTSSATFSNSAKRTTRAYENANGSDSAAEKIKIGWIFIGKFLMQRSSRLGAWKGRVHCPFCGLDHQEKFDLRMVGGKAGLVQIVEARLLALGWFWRRHTSAALEFMAANIACLPFKGHSSTTLNRGIMRRTINLIADHRSVVTVVLNAFTHFTTV